MNCPHCGGTKHRRAENASPADRRGVVFRAHQCLDTACQRIFLSAQIVVVNEFEPVARLDAVLKELMDESDARSRIEIEDAVSLEGMAE